MALAAPKATIEALVHADLTTIEGVLRLDELDGAELSDPLARLPIPADDLTLFATYPGVAARGAVRWEAISPQEWRFHTEIPSRYGDTGAAKGLHANGTWYPTITTSGALPLLEWEVAVRLPNGAVGALNATAGEGVLRWSGEAERVGLAAYRGGVLTDLPNGFTLLTPRAPRAALSASLKDAIRAVPTTKTGVIVEGPLRRRLARASAEMMWVSDRAFRLSPGLERFHRVAIFREFSRSFLPISDPMWRDLAAAGLASSYREALEGVSASEALSVASWTPRVDAMLANRTMPFFAEVLEETLPSDPLRDDLAEMVAPTYPGPLLWAQLRAAQGDEGAAATLQALLAGEPPPSAIDLLETYRRSPSWNQDYFVLPCESGPFMVSREAPPDAAPERLELLLDGQRQYMAFPQGKGSVVAAPHCPRSYRLDPRRQLPQGSREGDSWPPKLRLTAASWIDALSLTPLYLQGGAAFWVRRSDDTHNQWSGNLLTGETDWAQVVATYTRSEGRLIVGRRRAHNLSTWGSLSALREGYGDPGAGWGAAQGGMTYTWDNQAFSSFPRRGSALQTGFSAGHAVGGAQRWRSWKLTARTLASPHPRWVFAQKIGLATAQSDIPHRALSLGAAGALRSIPGGEILGTERGYWAGELRWVPLRGASIPVFGLVWGSELQLTAGAEGGSVRTFESRAWDEGWASAAGVTLGGGVAGDLFGLDPNFIGVTAALPVWEHGTGAPTRNWAWTLRWGQEF